MDFLDRLYSSNYFGIGLFAVIAFLVVTFLIVLFFGKKDAKKRKLEETQSIGTEDTFKETSTPTPVEIPANPEPVAPINLEANTPISEPVSPVVEPVNPTPIVEPVAPINTNVAGARLGPVTPVMPTPPVEPIKVEEDNNEFVDNLTVEEPVRPAPMPTVAPVTPVTPIITEEPKPEPKIMEPTKIEVPVEPVKPIISEPVTPVNPVPVTPIITEPTKPVEEVTPIIKEEEPKLQITEEPVINTYYKPVEKTEAEPIKVPNIDFDSLAKSISRELDELENNSKYEEIKVTPMSEVTGNRTNVRQPETFSSVYVKEPVKETPKETIELPKRIDLPARKSE